MRGHFRKCSLLYCGANTVILDQLFSHVCGGIMVNTAQGATKTF